MCQQFLHKRVATKQRATGNEKEQRASKAVNVTACICPSTIQCLFGGHVVDCSHQTAGRREIVAEAFTICLFQSGQPKVEHLNCAI